MYARLLIPAGEEMLVIIPADLVSSFGQLDVVWVKRDMQTERRFIRLGRQMGPNQVEVVSGLEAGEVLVQKPD